MDATAKDHKNSAENDMMPEAQERGGERRDADDQHGESDLLSAGRWLRGMVS